MNLNEPLLLHVNNEHVVVFFENKGTPDYKMSLAGSVYPCHETSEGFLMLDKNSSDVRYDGDRSKSECWFDFTYCWRGVWEGRIYHKEDEFWCEDLKTISAAWDAIEKILKEKIKTNNPDYGHFDE